MRSARNKWIVLLLVFSLLISITSIASAQFETEQPQAAAHVKFLHAAPFSDDIAATEVTVKFGNILEFQMEYEDVHPLHPDDQPLPEGYIEIESGDYLLSWEREGRGLRYVCAIDAQETEQLAEAADLEVLSLFRSDGREGNLNLYAILTHKETSKDDGGRE